MPKLLIIFAALFFFAPVMAQLSPAEEDTALYDENDEEENIASLNNNLIPDTVITFRNILISSDTIQALRKEKGHAWIKNIDSLLRGAQKNVQNSPRKRSGPSFMDGLLNSDFMKTVLWLLAFSFVGFIIYSLFLNKGFFKTSTTRAVKIIEEESEDISAANYEELSQKAYETADYKMAVRYLFLQTLQRLNARDFIVFSADKTNSMYVNELPVAKRNEFASLALYFEYIRYGNVSLTKETFDSIAIKYNAFINKI